MTQKYNVAAKKLRQTTNWHKVHFVTQKSHIHPRRVYPDGKRSTRTGKGSFLNIKRYVYQ